MERLAESLSSSALIPFDDSDLHVRLELIDDLQQTFQKIISELEELDLDEIESDLSEK